MDIEKKAREVCPIGSYGHEMTTHCCENIAHGIREVVESDLKTAREEIERLKAERDAAREEVAALKAIGPSQAFMKEYGEWYVCPQCSEENI